MTTYLALYFAPHSDAFPTLQEWQVRENQIINIGQTLFHFGEASKLKTFSSPVAGVFKTFLWKEGETLMPGEPVAVAEVDSAIAKQLEEKGLGRILSPEEAKSGMSYAEAASIRLPPR